MSNEEYDRRLGRRGAGLSPAMVLLLIGGIVVALPGMAIFAAAADLFALSFERSKGWGISIGISVAIFLVMRWLASSLKEAGKAYLSLSGIIALLFVLVHFGLESSLTARWAARFVPEGGMTQPTMAKELAKPSTARETPGLLASLQPSPRDLGLGQPAAVPGPGSLPTAQGTVPVPVRRAVAVTDDEPPFAALPLAPAVAATQGPAGSSTKYTITGIPFSDTLNVRAGPGAHFAKIHELRPGYDKIVGVSTPQMNGDTEWVLITFENYSGWVARQFIRAE